MFTDTARLAGRKLIGLVAGLGLALTAQTATAQSLIRDAEIEATLKMVALPVFRSAGLSPASTDVLVISDASLNAFVVNNRAIFVHSGLIMRMETPDMLQAVLAHEAAHITSGHLIRRTINAQSATTAVGLGLLLSLMVSAAGNAQAAAGLATGAASSAQRVFFSHTRAEETTADQIGTRYLARAKIDPKAAVRVLELFRGQEALSVGRQDPYARTHPLSSERIRTLEGMIAAYGNSSQPPSHDLLYWYGRMQAKFRGFIGNPSYVLRRVKVNDNSEPADIIRAVAYHRMGDTAKATAAMNALLKARPNDPFYHELKGQILLEGGAPAEAVVSYRRAVELAPKEPLILAGYGRALLGVNSGASNREALEALKRARSMDPRDERMLRDLALAWARSGNNGMASLVTAERYALLTRFKDAETHALRAEGLLPRGSSGWLQAQDIIGAAKAARRQ